MKYVSVRQALEHVSRYPEPVTDVLLNLPAWELIGRTLFDIANSPQPHDKTSMRRANIARNIIFKRLVGVRRAGTKPLDGTVAEIEFVDLTYGANYVEPAGVLDSHGGSSAEGDQPEQGSPGGAGGDDRPGT